MQRHEFRGSCNDKSSVTWNRTFIAFEEQQRQHYRVFIDRHRSLGENHIRLLVYSNSVLQFPRLYTRI